MSFSGDVMTMEYHRTGGYGYEYDDDPPPIYKRCPVCGYKTIHYDFKGLIFKDDKCVGCSNCLTMTDEYGQDMKMEGYR